MSLMRAAIYRVHYTHSAIHSALCSQCNTLVITHNSLLFAHLKFIPKVKRTNQDWLTESLKYIPFKACCDTRNNIYIIEV